VDILHTNTLRAECMISRACLCVKTIHSAVLIQYQRVTDEHTRDHNIRNRAMRMCCTIKNYMARFCTAPVYGTMQWLVVCIRRGGAVSGKVQKGDARIARGRYRGSVLGERGAILLPTIRGSGDRCKLPSGGPGFSLFCGFKNR